MTTEHDPSERLPPSSLLLLGVVALGASIEAAASEGGERPLVPEDSALVTLLLGVIALRDHLDRRLGPPPTTAPVPANVTLKGVLR